MTTIYVVTSGSYSDYSINAVFDSKEKAEAFAAYETAPGYHFGGFDIEEWELNQWYDPISRGLTCFEVRFADITKGDAEAKKIGATDETEHSWLSRVAHVRSYSTIVWAQDEQAALKIANERRMQFLLRLEQEA